MKIGIVSNFGFNNINYGGCFQALALNRFLREQYPEAKVETLYFQGPEYVVRTGSFWSILINRLKNKIYYSIRNKKYERMVCSGDLVSRSVSCDEFARREIGLIDHPLSAGELNSLEYDALIVGSDIVWIQTHNRVNRVFFLDFKARREFKKISYAASFGRDYIPPENVNKIRELLSTFDAISVREGSSVKMLNGIGITNAIHVLDPVFLLSAEEWSSYTESISDSIEPYIFVYLLGDGLVDRERIIEFSGKKKLKIVNIYNASGVSGSIDDLMSEWNIYDCSPQKWIWYIIHAEYVITDSFHASAFSVIFGKKFFSIKRHNSQLNNRIEDFLQTINQEDKLLTSDQLPCLDESSFVWNYADIKDTILKGRAQSVEFIRKAISEKGN